ncbi:MAG: hypothetical protein M1838_004514 [Thelocarpon superellum]|nr:MAG: hypothetical protein M1838_004514 [Thelocarpon superellum]
MEAAVKTFFSQPRFAVVGASNDPSKYGFKAHSLPVTPINPRALSITVSGTSYATAASISALPTPSETAISIITPPAITAQVLEEARENNVIAVWLQPGSFDEQVLALAKRFGAGIGGDGGDGGEGWCVLVDGEVGLDLAQREWKAQKL